MRNIGIYSGTFDPIHEGHIVFAKESLSLLDLDGVVFLPEQSPRNKNGVTDIDLRLKQINRKIKHLDRISTLLLDIPQFTILLTLPLLQKYFPDTQFTFLVGSDVALTLSRWPNIEQLPTSTHIAVGLRGKHTEQQMHASLRNLPKHISYSLVMTDKAHISSSQLRQNM